MTKSTETPRVRAARSFLYVSRIAFTLTVILILSTANWEIAEASAFTFLPIASIFVGPQSYPIGVLIFVPLLCGLAWLLARLLEQPRRPWNWGAPHTTIPLLGYGLLILIRMWPAIEWSRTVHIVLAVVFFWGVYFYVLQDWPWKWGINTVSLLTLLQGIVGSLQFLQQRSLGLTFFGEPLRLPDMPGLCVIESGGQRWLRAYGLTPHPNILGGYLGIGVLICLGAALAATGWHRRWLLICALAGGGGLLFSFSRSAWLGTLAALSYLTAVGRPWKQIRWPFARSRNWLLLATLLVALILTVVLLPLYGDLVGTRLFQHDNPLERRSINDRLTDLGQAWSLIREAPISGVGAGRYLDALWERTGTPTLPGFRTVYNVPLLATAELGILGGLFWLWLILAPPIALVMYRKKGGLLPHRLGWAAAFVTVTTVSVFQFYLYMIPGWWYALYPALLAGIWSRDKVPQTVRIEKDPYPRREPTHQFVGSGLCAKLTRRWPMLSLGKAEVGSAKDRHIERSGTAPLAEDQIPPKEGLPSPKR
jgi:hypothetical protein